jgi:hypothetical protein
MGIQLATAVSQPEVVFDKVHVTTLTVEQPLNTDDSKPPYYKVLIEYRLYGVDADGQRHYQSLTHEADVKDFFAVAMLQAQNGDPRLIQALATIEVAIAAIIAEQTGIATEVV